MQLEDYFLNSAWICINDIDDISFREILDLKVERDLLWKEGYELISNSFDEKIILNFKQENWHFLIGKYFFLNNNQLKETLSKLSTNSIEVHAFAIDVWSNHFHYSKAINGEIKRFWNQHDLEIINEGIPTKHEIEIEEKETANKILELANRITVPFELIEKMLTKQQVTLLK